MTSGNFAVVFKMKDEQSGKFYAVKCFTKEQEGRNESYKLIADELEYVSSNYLTPIRFLEKELFVDTDQTTETEFPVLLMDWVDGIPMDKYIQKNINNQYALELLAFRFSKLATWLLTQPFAHGDLKPENILVKEDCSIVLVDYDGMYVPAMQGQKSRELGSPNFRHPLRTEDEFNERIDDFSIVLIVLSLKAFTLNTELIGDYCTNDYMLFKEEDYLCLSKCEAMISIQNLLDDDELKMLIGVFLIVFAKCDLTLTSPRLLTLNNPKTGYAYGEYLYNQARNLCDKAEDKSKIDCKKAFKLFINAANIGYADAQCCVGCCYKHGYGTEKDYSEARVWYDKSSKNGCARALRHIAMCYEDGLGVEKDINQAINWYKKAIESGDKYSMVIIGSIYYYGKNEIAINHVEAFKWYAKAAEEGDSDGMWRLGMCYENGMGVNMDWDMAREWYEKASKLGNKKAKNALDNLDLPF
jgi:tetratricopeptide (TPR) repeat protein